VPGGSASGGSASGDDWKLVSRRKRDTTVRGEKKSEGSFRGVGRSLDLYVGRCDKSFTRKILENYMKTDIGIEVLNCECISSDSLDTKSFKVSVAANDRNNLLNQNLWLEHIRVRKYFKPRSHGGQ